MKYINSHEEDLALKNGNLKNENIALVQLSLIDTGMNYVCSFKMQLL